MSSIQKPQGRCLSATLRRPPVTNSCWTFFKDLEKLWYVPLHILLKCFSDVLISNKSLCFLKDIDIKKVNGVPQYAFVQYSDIASVCKAIKKMDGEYLGSNRLKVFALKDVDIHVFFSHDLNSI